MLFSILFLLWKFYTVTGWQCPIDLLIPSIYVKSGQSAILDFQTTLKTSDGLLQYSVIVFNNSNIYSAAFYNNVFQNEKTYLGSDFIGNALTGNFTVKTNGVQTQDGGVYWLGYKLGTIDLNTEKCTILFVLGKPKKATLFHDDNNILGRNSTLSCSSLSTTYPTNHTLSLTYNWKVNDITNPANTRYMYGASRKTLTIIYVAKEDANKRFKCSVTESGNGVTGLSSDYSDEFLLTVIYGPDSSTTKLDPAKTEYTLNEDARLNDITCIGDCYPFCNFKWTQPGTNGELIVSNSAVLSLGILSRTEAATYTCEVTNAKDTERTERKQVVVYVSYGPDEGSVKLNPVKNRYTENENTHLSDVICSTACFPPCSFEWKQSGTNTVVSNTGVLTLGTLNRAKAATYTCTATNPRKSGIATVDVIVNVRYGPDECKLGVRSPLILAEGETSPIISCGSECFPSCSHTWRNVSGSAGIGANGTFQLVNAARYYAGDYECTCRNTATEYIKTHTSTLQIDVRYTSFFVEGDEGRNDITVDEYEDGVTITCLVNSYWESTIEIMFQNEVLKRQFHTRLLSFTRNSITCLHAGIYTCKGRNLHGEAPSATISLFVRCSPRPLRQTKQNFTSSLYESMTLQFTTIAYPEPGSSGFVWHKESGIRWIPLLSNTDLLISSSGLHSNLTIMNVSQQDFGQYRVTVTNEIGSFEHYLFLVEKDEHKQPIPTDNCKVDIDKTGLIVGICFGVLSAVLTVYSTFITIALKRKTSILGIQSKKESTKQAIYINIAEGGTSENTNSSREHGDKPIELYTDLARSPVDAKTTYDVIQTLRIQE